MTTKDDVQQAVKDAPVLVIALPMTIEKTVSEERDIGTLQWYQCEELLLET